MIPRLSQTAALLALAAFSMCAPAQTVLQTDTLEQGQVGAQSLETEPPGRVGRVSLVQGKVDISTDLGAEGSSAQVNWPVTSGNLINTAPGARTEIRIGSTSIRLDGDSSLAINELDDDSLHLRLHYGSVSVRVMNAEVVPEFELRTVHATVRLSEPGRLRVDAEKVRDTTLVTVLDGQGQVDGGGASLTLRGGRSAEVRDEDVRTMQARRDNFDDWSLTRDQALVAAQSTRHIGTEMTGYEDLDRYGSWSTSSDYGSLWTPQVAADWTPYRDGSWSYIAPWGWTWIDNAPWGYAPFHYGRWVQVSNRWAWAPGRLERRPVWSPALVGWVGGSNWNVGFQSNNLAAHGWYPLSPYDRYVPGYRLSNERLRRLNDWRHATRRAQQHDGRPRGLTVVPRDQFGGRGPVVVPRAPRPNNGGFVVPRDGGNAPPPPMVARLGRDNDRRAIIERANGERIGRERLETDRVTSDRITRDRIDADRLGRERANGERLARDRAQLQDQVRQQGERDRMQREQDDRFQADRTRFQVERRDRDGRDRMREQAERSVHQPLVTNNPAASFARPEPRPERQPERQREPRPEARSVPTMVAAPPPQAQPSTPGFAPPSRGEGRGEGRGHTDARGVSHRER